MEEGSLRCDANVSVRPAGHDDARHQGGSEERQFVPVSRRRRSSSRSRGRPTCSTSGGRVRQETRLWDSARGETVSMRSKEEAHDYRYFPEPDLPPVIVDAGWIARFGESLPELPEAREGAVRRRVRALASTTLTCSSGCCRAAPTTSRRRSPPAPRRRRRATGFRARSAASSRTIGAEDLARVADSSGGAGGAGRARRARRHQQLASPRTCSRRCG